MFLCILRAHQRTQNTQKHVQKDELRRSRNMYGRIAPKVCHTLYAGKRESVSLPLERMIEIMVQLFLYRKYIFRS